MLIVFCAVWQSGQVCGTQINPCDPLQTPTLRRALFFIAAGPLYAVDFCNHAAAMEDLQRRKTILYLAPQMYELDDELKNLAVAEARFYPFKGAQLKSSVLG